MFLKVLFHLFMTFITGGLWLIGLIIYHIVAGSKKRS